MKELDDIILESLLEAKKRNLDAQDTSELIAQAVGRFEEARYNDELRHIKSYSNNLNIVLMKIIRDLFSFSAKSKYEPLLQIGLINSKDGLKELQNRWIEFYKKREHLEILKNAASHISKSLISEFIANDKEILDLIKDMENHPQNLSDVEFLSRIDSIIALKKSRENKEVLGYSKLAGRFIIDVFDAKNAGDLETLNNTKNPFTNLVREKGKDRNIYQMLYDLCEAWRNEIALKKTKAQIQQEEEIKKAKELDEQKAKEEQELKQAQEEKAKQAAQETKESQNQSQKEEQKESTPPPAPPPPSSQEWKKTQHWKDTELLFRQTKDARLCAVRIFNYDEILETFGSEGHSRAFMMMRQTFMRHLTSVRKGKDIFEPKQGVFYLLAHGDKKRVESCFDCFLEELASQVFIYDEERRIMDFEGRIFGKEKDFSHAMDELARFLA